MGQAVVILNGAAPVTLPSSVALRSKPAPGIADYSPEACAKPRALELHLCCEETDFFFLLNQHLPYLRF